MTAWLRHTELVDSGRALEAAGLSHRVRRTRGGGPHATVVMLHGRHGDEHAMWPLSPALPPDWLVVAPRAPLPHPDGGFDWRPRKTDEWPTLADFDDAVAAVIRFTSALPELYDADRHSIHLMGFSQGAATAFATAIAQRDLARGVASVVGFVPARCESLVSIRPLRGLPVFLAVGRRDPLIPLERSRACATTLRAVGAAVTYHEYDVGHKLSTAGMRDLRAWWPPAAPGP